MTYALIRSLQNTESMPSSLSKTNHQVHSQDPGWIFVALYIAMKCHDLFNSVCITIFSAKSGSCSTGSCNRSTNTGIIGSGGL